MNPYGFCRAALAVAIAEYLDAVAHRTPAPIVSWGTVPATVTAAPWSGVDVPARSRGPPLASPSGRDEPNIGRAA
jgi:hypothetical protein